MPVLRPRKNDVIENIPVSSSSATAFIVPGESRTRPFSASKTNDQNNFIEVENIPNSNMGKETKNTRQSSISRSRNEVSLGVKNDDVFNYSNSSHSSPPVNTSLYGSTIRSPGPFSASKTIDQRNNQTKEIINNKPKRLLNTNINEPLQPSSPIATTRSGPITRRKVFTNSTHPAKTSSNISGTDEVTSSKVPLNVPSNVPLEATPQGAVYFSSQFQSSAVLPSFPDGTLPLLGTLVFCCGSIMTLYLMAMDPDDRHDLTIQLSDIGSSMSNSFSQVNTDSLRYVGLILQCNTMYRCVI